MNKIDAIEKKENTKQNINCKIQLKSTNPIYNDVWQLNKGFKGVLIGFKIYQFYNIKPD